MGGGGGGGGGVEVRRISRYSSKTDILLIGEGDFSFAAALAGAFKSAPNMVATSLDSLDTLKRKYPVAFESNLATLERAGVEVMHGVDATTMAKDWRLRGRQFECIIFNFPHSGFIKGLREYTPALIKKHRQLLKGFFKNAAKLACEDVGEIHVTHHKGWPYTEWKITEEAQESGLRLARSPPFKAHAYPGYVNRRGAGAHWGGTFPSNNAATYIFV